MDAERAVLGFVLMLVGFVLGWKTRPIFWEWVLEQECGCGSGKRLIDCCYIENIENN